MVRAARNEELGLKAVSKLENENIKKVYFHQLDIENQESINRFASYIKEKHGGLDISNKLKLLNLFYITGRRQKI